MIDYKTWILLPEKSSKKLFEHTKKSNNNDLLLINLQNSNYLEHYLAAHQLRVFQADLNYIKKIKNLLKLL